MRGSPKLAFAAAAVLAIAGITAACSSSSKTTRQTTVPPSALATVPGTRAWSTTITDGSRSFRATFTLGPVQQVSTYPGGLAALKARCESASGLQFSATGDALVRGSLSVTNTSAGAASINVVLNPLQSPPLWPVLTAGSSCTGSDLRGMRLKFDDLTVEATSVRDDFVFILQGYYDATHPTGDPAVANRSFVSVVAMGTRSSVATLSGPGAYQHTVPAVVSADAAAYCRTTGKVC